MEPAASACVVGTAVGPAATGTAIDVGVGEGLPGDTGCGVAAGACCASGVTAGDDGAGAGVGVGVSGTSVGTGKGVEAGTAVGVASACCAWDTTVMLPLIDVAGIACEGTEPSPAAIAVKLSDVEAPGPPTTLKVTLAMSTSATPTGACTTKTTTISEGVAVFATNSAPGCDSANGTPTTSTTAGLYTSVN